MNNSNPSGMKNSLTSPSEPLGAIPIATATAVVPKVPKITKKILVTYRLQKFEKLSQILFSFPFLYACATVVMEKLEMRFFYLYYLGILGNLNNLSTK